MGLHASVRRVASWGEPERVGWEFHQAPVKPQPKKEIPKRKADFFKHTPWRAANGLGRLPLETSLM
ncbi:hypothetical protein [Spirosoma pulveris]